MRSWLLFLLMMTGAARAEVYRCPSTNGTMWTDHACAVGARPAELPPLGRMPGMDAPDLARQHDAALERSRANHQREDRAWLREYAERKADNARVETAIAEHRIMAGMTKDQVHRVMGMPDSVTRDGDGEVWHYGGAKGGRNVRFEDGRMKTGAGKAGAGGHEAGSRSRRRK